MSWTDERIAVLKKLWGEGKSAAEIAKALGGGLTRNAVIGKAHRLKLSNRVSPIQQNNKKPAGTTAPAPVAVAKIVEEKKPAPKRAAPVPVKKSTGGVAMVNLKDRMCRWPHGDPKDADFHFCGDDSVAGLPYCDDHAKAAYQTSTRARTLNADDFLKERASSAHDLSEDELKDVAASA
jgi:GcrA cell cycle regulator